MKTINQSISPTQPLERISSLDFLRGIAILGILVINIESFSYPNPWSPYKYGFSSATDQSTRFWVYFLAQGKFFSMFTLLFGVGFCIFLERLEKKNLGLKAMDIYSRRLLWLFLIGVVHAYFLWDGDVLYHYAICGFLLIPFRSYKVKSLLMVLLVPIGVLLFNSYQNTSSTQNQFEAYTKALITDEEARSSEEQKSIEKWEKRTQIGVPDQSEINSLRNTYSASILENFKHTNVHKGALIYNGILFRTLIMMLLGVIIYRLGVFQNLQSVPFYWLFTFLILTVGLAINYYRYYHWTFEYFDPIRNIWTGWLFTFPKEMLGLAYILFFNGIYQKYLKNLKFKPFSNLGKMALTNYIFQSIICGLIFYGYGTNQFNNYSRTELLLIVPFIWIFLIVFSWLWMKNFRYGPLEYVWRKLTYKSFQN
ncbi:DUF418 domain-containing protein [Marivirga sp. S37H4]|uniref:DUF418 domain-containing protein n=1 Tax=Marivirga aurantiaca TaxID=2802615 RepID=A0A935CBZ7_9BACT|nr:DUF418 domain-containing protein [Marivirga aurantiaca]MBK6265663.1 DUF418 domain-containing protein [Marivirga aurantiaca]